MKETFWEVYHNMYRKGMRLLSGVVKGNNCNREGRGDVIYALSAILSSKWTSKKLTAALEGVHWPFIAKR